VNSETNGQGLLDGIRILDLADEKASFCTKLLADLGAHVVKIEKPGGDQSRRMGPFWENTSHPEKSLSFFYHNTNKLGITLDLDRERGREIFLELVKRYDIIVETFPPGYLSSLKLDFNFLKAVNRRLILVSVTGFGRKGPRKAYKSCDLVASAYGGQMYVTGSPTSPPLKAYGGQSYYLASLFAAIGILLAIQKRSQTGIGEHIDISLQEAVTATLEHVMIRFFSEAIIAGRQGSLHWNHAFKIFACKDGFIHLTLFQNWETLVEWLDSEGMAEDLKDKKWNDEDYRRQHIEHIIEVVERWTKTHRVEELFELGQLMHFPWAPVLSPKDILNSAQLNARKFFVPVHHSENKTDLSYPQLPFRFSSGFIPRKKRAPLPGRDNAKIYKGELGFSNREIQQLLHLNVI
jgi:crotonobetainyl-CoA:carnitine CoA-transferase CaiB-like acyl-CoA transferase